MCNREESEYQSKFLKTFPQIDHPTNRMLCVCVCVCVCPIVCGRVECVCVCVCVCICLYLCTCSFWQIQVTSMRDDEIRAAEEAAMTLSNLFQTAEKV